MSSVVVLTENFAYWGERDLYDAINLWYKGKAEILKADESRLIRSGINRNGVTLKIPAPLVIRLLKFTGFKVKEEKIQYSHDAVYERDKNICGYWHFDAKGRRFRYRCDHESRSIDHIIPQFAGGPDSFTNCICACKNCNINIKKNHTLEESGLQLVKSPVVPKRRKGDMVVITFAFNPSNKAHVALYDYLGTQFNHVAS